MQYCSNIQQHRTYREGKIMKTSAFIVAFLLAFVACSMTARADEKAANKYVGTKQCAPCHKSDKVGNQFGIWQKAKHSSAYTVLATPAADAIAKKAGSTKP